MCDLTTEVKEIMCSYMKGIVYFDTNTVFYRGGERKDDSIIKIRLSNIFLSHTGATTLLYSQWRNDPLMRFHYAYRAFPCRKLILIEVNNQRDLCIALSKHFDISNIYIEFQRDLLVDLYRKIHNNIDGIFYRDGINSECIVDNSEDILRLYDYIIIKKDDFRDEDMLSYLRSPLPL